MLTKARKKGEKPSWVGDKAWDGLLAHWESEDFRKISAQNKTNRASAKGGAVHTTGRKSHNDVALDMAVQLGRPVEPDELFLATHKRKSDDWVDSRSQRTYDSYQQCLNQIQTQVESSMSGSQELDGARKLELWKEVAGGKTRGRCYGTADLSSNILRGISSMTQESRAPSSRSDGYEGERAAQAEERIARAEEKAARAEARYDNLEDQFRTMMERMPALEHKSRGASCGASQSRRHPDYDDDLDDHSLDEASPYGRRR